MWSVPTGKSAACGQGRLDELGQIARRGGGQLYVQPLGRPLSPLVKSMFKVWS